MSDTPAARTDALIRPVREGDLDGLLALMRHLNPSDVPADDAAQAASWAAMLASPLVTVVVAEMQGVLAASCVLVVVPNLTRGGRPFAVIENVVTHGGYRRQGLGHAVLAEAVARARQAGCYKVMLATGSKEPGTHRFYQEAGFASGSKTQYEMRLPMDAAP